MNFQKKLNNIECEDIVSNLDLNKNDIVYVFIFFISLLVQNKILLILTFSSHALKKFTVCFGVFHLI